MLCKALCFSQHFYFVATEEIRMIIVNSVLSCGINERSVSLITLYSLL